MLFDDMCPRGAVSAGARSVIVGSKQQSGSHAAQKRVQRTVSGGGVRRRRHRPVNLV